MLSVAGQARGGLAPPSRRVLRAVLPSTLTGIVQGYGMPALVRLSATRRRRPSEVLTESGEAIALLRACSTRAPTGIRSRALIAVLWRCGLRISEALTLELRDLDLEHGTLRVRHSKGDKSRTLGLDEQTAALLARWLDRRRSLGAGARAPVFCTLHGDRLDPSYIRRLLPRLAAKAGIEGGQRGGDRFSEISLPRIEA